MSEDASHLPSSGNTRSTTQAKENNIDLRQIQLTVVKGGRKGESFRAVDDKMVLGTHESSDVCLDDPTVSRFHCEICVEDGRPLIRDLGSKNHTFVNGVPVIQAILPRGAVLTLGQTEIHFELSTTHIHVPLATRTHFGSLVGRSEHMRAVYSRLEQASASDSTVLLTGETGTGKELAAESIHTESARADKPFVVVDCGSIPPELLESELFGHEKGSFTGALSSRIGAFEEANGGTIFLDEIGELPIEIQPKFLRVLEKRAFKRVGSNQYTPTDVRVVAATNRSLFADVNEGLFRSDLYYRVAVLEIRLPPLRDRPSDLPFLVEAILKSLGKKETQEGQAILAESNMARLRRKTWGGNVRELRNVVERSLAFRDMPGTDSIAPEPNGMDDLVDTSLPFRRARERWSTSLERDYFRKIIERENGNISAVARFAELDRIYLYRVLKKLGLR